MPRKISPVGTPIITSVIGSISSSVVEDVNAVAFGCECCRQSEVTRFARFGVAKCADAVAFTLRSQHKPRRQQLEVATRGPQVTCRPRGHYLRGSRPAVQFSGCA